MAFVSAVERAALLLEDTAIVGKPFSPHGNNARAIQANARHLALMLRDTTIENRASKAAAFAEQLLDVTLHTHVTGPVECARGCDHCCKTYVSATVPEILHLARAVRGQAAKTARVNDLAAKSRAMAQLDREAARLHCPMLEDRACSEYLSRPLVCRAVLSKSLATCQQIFQQNLNVPFTPADQSATIRMYCVIILRAGIILAGLPHQHVEMNHALEIALADPDAETRWLKGEPVFAAVSMDIADTQPSPLSQVVDGMVNALRPTL
ncbi:MAG: YkgJ family cysteine cluster protein [Rhodospirillaceae bacterium]